MESQLNKQFNSSHIIAIGLSLHIQCHSCEGSFVVAALRGVKRLVSSAESHACTSSCEQSFAIMLEVAVLIILL